MTDSMTTTDVETIEAPAAEVAAPAVEAPIEGVDILGSTEPAVEDAVVAAPEAYELTAPEGFDNLDAELVDLATPIFKELNLSNEDANKIVGLMPQVFARAEAAFTGKLESAMLQQKATWADEAMKDPEIGGDKWKDTLDKAARGMAAMGFGEGHPFRVSLSETGFGNNKDMISVFRKFGELAGESSFVAGSAAKGTEDTLSAMYPNNRRNK